MIETKEIKTLEDFEAINKGDILACEWHRDVYVNKGKDRTRFAVYTVYERNQYDEVILNKKDNTYFNYKLFLDPNENSNLKSALKISHLEGEGE